MPKRDRGTEARLRTSAQPPTPELFQATLSLLKNLESESPLSEKELAPAARYLAQAIAAYSNMVKHGLTLSKRDDEADISYRELQAAKLSSFATEMLKIIQHPATRYTILNPSEEDALRDLLDSLVNRFHDSTPHTTPKEIRKRARAIIAKNSPPNINKKSPPKEHRQAICRAIAYAWEIATNTKTENRKINRSTEKPYGNFHDFIEAALQLTKETHLINTDELHRDIKNMGL